MTSKVKKNNFIVNLFICIGLSFITPISTSDPVTTLILLCVMSALQLAINLAILDGYCYCKYDYYWVVCSVISSILTLTLFILNAVFRHVVLKYSVVWIWAALCYVLVFIISYLLIKLIGSFFIWLFTFDPDDIKNDIKRSIKFKKDKNVYDITNK